MRARREGNGALGRVSSMPRIPPRRLHASMVLRTTWGMVEKMRGTAEGEPRGEGGAWARACTSDPGAPSALTSVFGYFGKWAKWTSEVALRLPYSAVESKPHGA